jgi:hypothetical protein
MRKRGGRAKCSCERVSRFVDRDLTGKLIDVNFSFYFILLGVQRKEEQTNWNISPPLHPVLVEIAHLADEKQNPESKRVGDPSRVSSFLGYSSPRSPVSCCLSC